MLGVIEAACVDVEQDVAGFGAEADSIEVGALIEGAI